MKKATLVATLSAPPSAEGAELSDLPATVEWLEVRSDLLGDLDPDWLRDRFPGRLLYSLRSSAEGGEFADSPRQRHERLTRAGRGYDLIELEAGRDLVAEVLDEIPARQRLVSWRGAGCDLPALQDRFGQLTACPAALYTLVTEAANVSEQLAVLALLRSLGRDDTLAYSAGPLGFWTRMVAPHLGAPFVFGSVPGGRPNPAEPSINRLIEDYGLPMLAPVEGLYGIVGNPVFHSLSPRLHNAAYRELNYPALFVPFQADSFAEFWREAVEGEVLESAGVPVKGLTVASPHKESALATVAGASEMARRAESANIVVRDGGAWRADTTDPEVVFTAQREHGVRMERKRAAVIGCGGAGRAIAAALEMNGAGVTMVNRGAERGRYAARLLDLPYTPLSTFSAGGFDVVVNATPVGRDDGAAPFDVHTLGGEGVVIDLVYGSAPTPLVAGAGGNGRVVIDGREVLLAQVLRQFQLMTGLEMPEGVVRERLGLTVGASDLVAAG